MQDADISNWNQAQDSTELNQAEMILQEEEMHEQEMHQREADIERNFMYDPVSNVMVCS
jgi:hypothetical protein